MKKAEIIRLCSLAFGIIFFATSCSEKQETTKPTRTSITEAVYASGKIKAKNEYQLYSSVSGVIEHIYFNEGDTAAEGEVIIEIKSERADYNADIARQNLDLVQKKYVSESPVIQELEIRIKEMQSQLSYDSLDYYRKKRLMTQNIGTQNQLDKAKLAYEATQKKIQTLYQQLASLKDELYAEYSNARDRLKIEEFNAGEYRVKSLYKSRVYQLFKEVGELVNAQEPLALLGDPGQFYIELEVDEMDITRIKKGRKVLLTMDASNKQVFEAKITKIYPLMDELTQTFRVEAEFTKAPEVLYPNLTAEANIIIQTKENALVVPKSYIRNGKVWNANNEEITITTGISNMEYVEILSGIDAETELIKPK